MGQIRRYTVMHTEDDGGDQAALGAEAIPNVGSRVQLGIAWTLKGRALRRGRVASAPRREKGREGNLPSFRYVVWKYPPIIGKITNGTKMFGNYQK